MPETPRQLFLKSAGFQTPGAAGGVRDGSPRIWDGAESSHSNAKHHTGSVWGGKKRQELEWPPKAVNLGSEIYTEGLGKSTNGLKPPKASIDCAFAFSKLHEMSPKAGGESGYCANL